jgi:hypothetical protein
VLNLGREIEGIPLKDLIANNKNDMGMDWL